MEAYQRGMKDSGISVSLNCNCELRGRASMEGPEQKAEARLG